MARDITELKGTKTEANLMEAFSGESQAHTKYLFYAAKAKEDGYEQIGDIFRETARNEKMHAQQWFQYLHDGGIPTSTTNLVDAAAGEHYEWTDMYARMAAEAREEGFTQIAAKFDMVGAIEKGHEERYLHLLKNVEDGLVFTRDGDTIWQCAECGHIVIGKKAPMLCPVCRMPQSFFAEKASNY